MRVVPARCELFYIDSLLTPRLTLQIPLLAPAMTKSIKAANGHDLLVVGFARTTVVSVPGPNKLGNIWPPCYS